MTPLQQHHTLNWVELLLSGKYKHGKGLLYIPTLDRYSALGVALVEAGQPRNDIGLFLEADEPETNGIICVKDLGGFVSANKTFVRQSWFDKRFGTNRQVDVIKTMNDLTNDYFAVCVLLLDSCPVNERQRKLHDKLMEQYLMAKETVGTDR